MARYWRLVGISTLGGVALELSSARLSDGTAYSAAAVTCTVAPQTGVIGDLVDGNLTTVVSWSNYAQPGFALVWDCDASPITDALVELGSGVVQDNFPLTGRLEYSDDGSFWTVYFEANRVNWPGANALTADPLSVGTLAIDSTTPTQIYALNNSTVTSNLPGSDLQPFAQYLTSECKFASDTQDGGTGKVSGTVKETGAPDDVPVHRKVRLLEEVSGRAIRETWSDAVTGYYEFKDLSLALKYTVISYDYHRNYRAVIADNQSALP